jgi:hypothetical protein
LGSPNEVDFGVGKYLGTVYTVRAKILTASTAGPTVRAHQSRPCAPGLERKKLELTMSYKVFLKITLDKAVDFNCHRK